MQKCGVKFCQPKLKNDSKKEFQARQLMGLAVSHCDIKSYRKALSCASQAISFCPFAKFYAKRSLIHLILRDFVLAASDATCAIAIDKSCAAAYFCRAFAFICLEDYELAMKDFTLMRNSLPNSKLCNDIYVECRNMFASTGKLEPFELPTSISDNFLDEDESIFDRTQVEEAISTISEAGIIDSSGAMTDFLQSVIKRYQEEPYHLSMTQIYVILYNILTLMKECDNVVNIEIPLSQKLTVVGDIRGNFNNLKAIMSHKRSPQYGQSCLFNGNLIGEYKSNLSCLVFVFCLKLLRPNDIFIARGDEECLERCSENGFENEVLSVYNENILKGFSEVFNWLPIAHVLNNSVLIVHGGLFENEKVSLKRLQKMWRAYQPPEEGPMCDVLCSDPWNSDGVSKHGRKKGVWFGPNITRAFCHRNHIDYIVRSHQIPNTVGFGLQENHRCITINSSTAFASYLLLWGETTLFSVFHALRGKPTPDNCKCWAECNCEEGLTQQPHTAVKIHGIPKLQQASCTSLRSNVDFQNASDSSASIIHGPSRSQSTLSEHMSQQKVKTTLVQNSSEMSNGSLFSEVSQDKVESDTKENEDESAFNSQLLEGSLPINKSQRSENFRIPSLSQSTLSENRSSRRLVVALDSQSRNDEVNEEEKPSAQDSIESSSKVNVIVTQNNSLISAQSATGQTPTTMKETSLKELYVHTELIKNEETEDEKFYSSKNSSVTDHVSSHAVGNMEMDLDSRTEKRSIIDPQFTRSVTSKIEYHANHVNKDSLIEEREGVYSGFVEAGSHYSEDTFTKSKEKRITTNNEESKGNDSLQLPTAESSVESSNKRITTTNDEAFPESPLEDPKNEKSAEGIIKDILTLTETSSAKDQTVVIPQATSEGSNQVIDSLQKSASKVGGDGEEENEEKETYNADYMLTIPTANHLIVAPTHVLISGRQSDLSWKKENSVKPSWSKYQPSKSEQRGAKTQKVKLMGSLLVKHSSTKKGVKMSEKRVTEKIEATFNERATKELINFPLVAARLRLQKHQS